MMACFPSVQAVGQFTALNADGEVATQYANPYGTRDPIFVFNQMPQPKSGNLSLIILETSEESEPELDPEPDPYIFKWYRFDYSTREFVLFDEVTDISKTSKTDLEQGGYKVTVTPPGEVAPRDSSVAWLYMNPGFNFSLLKDNNGEVIWNFAMCEYTDFVFGSKTVQSSFLYYNTGNLSQALTFDNRITFNMKAGNDSEVVVLLNTQGDRQYLRVYEPPYEDTQYNFRASDMFKIEKRDDIMYRTVVPYIKEITPKLPEKDPSSAPVPVEFTWKPYNVSEYVWRFGDGDSIVYNLEFPATDTVKHIYYTPKTQGYNLVVKVTSELGCTYKSEPVNIKVDMPSLDVPNVFTPNNDHVNDFFKPDAISLRGFEISIYTRAGKRVYHHRGNDLRDWEGWDGRIENTGKEAAVGVYIYVIKAAGWDEPSTKNPKVGPYSGVIHLYR